MALVLSAGPGERFLLPHCSRMRSKCGHSLTVYHSVCCVQERAKRCADTDGVPRCQLSTPSKLFEKLEACKDGLTHWVGELVRFLVSLLHWTRVLHSCWLFPAEFSVLLCLCAALHSFDHFLSYPVGIVLETEENANNRGCLFVAHAMKISTVSIHTNQANDWPLCIGCWLTSLCTSVS